MRPELPAIDPSVKYVGVSRLRALNSEKLRALEGALVLQDDEEPLAVLIPFKTFLAMQEALKQP